MYIPEAFAENDLATLHEFIRQHSFATLVTQHEGVPFASHLPMFLDSNTGTHGALLGHMARNNPQWQDLVSGTEVLIVFQGAHAYVSPAWYEPNPMSVPTWNYVSVHAYGVARILSEEELEQTLYQLTGENEKVFEKPWELSLSTTMRERMLSAIVGFEITLRRIEGKFKLSQNRSEQDRQNVISELSTTVHGKDVAQWMSKQLERK
ncbi:MAG: FMN-binding negative transcriptional regulator [Sideroxydans sp.]|nr:FMN-binding negative transcriptional regulator [Sideroxydans sp.]